MTNQNIPIRETFFLLENGMAYSGTPLRDKYGNIVGFIDADSSNVWG